jgi:hypothetical protein
VGTESREFGIKEGGTLFHILRVTAYLTDVCFYSSTLLMLLQQFSEMIPLEGMGKAITHACLILVPRFLHFLLAPACMYISCFRIFLIGCLLQKLT